MSSAPRTGDGAPRAAYGARHAAPRPRAWPPSTLLRACAALLAAAAGACDLEPLGPAATRPDGIVAVGGLHVCRINPAGEAYCWGNNGVGQLGDGSLANRSVPSRVAGSLELETISAGQAHTCAIDRDALIHCWGTNAARRLGDSGVALRTFPVEVVRDFRFVALTTGGAHTCALILDGRPLCWGSNTAGQLGVRALPPECGGGTCSGTPVAVDGDFRFTQLTAGGTHTCGLTGDGAAYCWGANGAGQLGNGTFIGATAPVLVAGGHRFIRLSAGSAHTCAVASGGAVYCWGLNSTGQLGAPTPSEEPECCAARPLRAGHAGPFTAVAAAGEHTCALTTRGRTFCWGANGAGQLGNGSSFDRVEPQRVVGNVRFHSLAAGGATSCGIGFDGMTYCWGDNFRLQLGNGGRGIRSTEPIPVAVPGTE